MHILTLIYSTNHLCIGFLHILYGLIGGSFGYGLPLILRIELTSPGFILCPPPQYNPIITFHGLFTTSFMIMPILIGGFGNFPIPLLPCPSDMIFPRLNALSLWLVFVSLFLIELFSIIFQSITLANRLSINLIAGSLSIQLMVVAFVLILFGSY